MMMNSKPDVSSFEAIESQMVSWLEEILGDSTEFMLPELATMYLEDAPPLLQKMSDAANNKDNIKLKNSAHTLKGSSSSMGLHTFSNLCHKAESAAKRNEFEGMNNLILHAQAELRQIEKVLQRYAE